MCPKDTDAPAWKTLLQIASRMWTETDWRTGVTLYAFSTILLMCSKVL